MSRHRRITRGHGLPLAARALLAVSIVALGGTMLWIAIGAVGPAASGLVRGLGSVVGAVGNVVGSPSPTALPGISGAPTIVPPKESYTNLDSVDITVDVPQDVAGRTGYSVRLWVTLPNKPAVILANVPVGPTAEMVIPGVILASGRNDIQASIMGPSGDSVRSPVVTWVLDQVPPKITIISPKDGTAVTGGTVTIRGKTQARSSIVFRNDVNGATASTAADTDGLFEAAVTVAAGTNAITITATDPAGNANSMVLNIRKGSGRLIVTLTGTVYRFTAAKLPQDATFTVVVTGPDGRPIAGANVLFTVTVPGLQAIVSPEIPTGSDGSATFSTQIPSGAMAGVGLASVLVTTTSDGTGTDRQVLTVQ